ncbi:MAG: prenyltransferase [Thermoplasmata archaeon]
MNLMEFLKGLKAPLYFTSVSPVLIGWAFSSFKTTYLLALLLLVTTSMQAGMNLAMDFFDHKNGRPLRNEDTFFPIGSLFIEKLHVRPESIRISFISMMMIAVASGLTVVFITRNVLLLYLGLLAVLLSLLYVLPPVKLGARGVGEIATFFAFGPFTVIGTVIALGGSVSLEVIFVSMSLGLLASSIRYLHHLPEDNPGGIRVRYFRLFYPIMVLGATIMTSIFRSTEIPAIAVFIGGLIHIAFLPKGALPISRRTNQSVLIHFSFTVLILLFFAVPF